MNPLRFSLAAPLLIATAGCGDVFDPVVPPDRDLAAGLQTSELAYTLESRGDGIIGVDIPYTVHNRTSERVFIVNCGGATATELERLVDGVWKRVWSAVIPACLSPPIELDVGSTLERSIDVSGGTANCFCAPIFEDGQVAGVYRIVHASFVHGYDEGQSGFGDIVPEVARVSNAFTLSR